MSCCNKPRIANSDYRRYPDWKSREFTVVTNRHCMHCGSHLHDGKQYTRAEWDRALTEQL